MATSYATPPTRHALGSSWIPESGASASCGYRGDAAAAAAYLEKWKAAFRPVAPHLSTSTPDPEGEVWAATSLAVDGAFIEDLSDVVVDVLSSAAIEGRGVGQMLLGLSNGVVARIPMTATAYPLRGTGLSTLISAEWHKPGGTRAGRAVGVGDWRGSASLGAPCLRELPAAERAGASS